MATTTKKSIKNTKTTKNTKGSKPKSAKKSTKKSTKKSPVKKTNSRIKKLANDGYVRPKVTASELLSKEDIEERLKDYKRLYKADIESLKDGDHIRYFEVNGKNTKYKPGGYVVSNGYPKYIVLSNNRSNWCVQLDNHILYKRLDVELLVADIRKDCELQISKRDEKIDELIAIINKQKDVILKMKKTIDRQSRQLRQ
jgi:hypothetical protein